MCEHEPKRVFERECVSTSACVCVRGRASICKPAHVQVCVCIRMGTSDGERRFYLMMR